LYDYLALWGITVITVCIIILTNLIYIFWGISVVALRCQSIYITFTYILLPTFTSDKLVMSRGNSKIFTYAFCKSGALQWRSFQSIEAVPQESTFAQQDYRGRDSRPLLSSITISGKLSLDTRRPRDPKAIIFHHQGPLWCKGTVSPDRETGIDIDSLDKKAKCSAPYFKT